MEVECCAVQSGHLWLPVPLCRNVCSICHHLSHHHYRLSSALALHATHRLNVFPQSSSSNSFSPMPSLQIDLLCFRNLGRVRTYGSGILLTEIFIPLPHFQMIIPTDDRAIEIGLFGVPLILKRSTIFNPNPNLPSFSSSVTSLVLYYLLLFDRSQ